MDKNYFILPYIKVDGIPVLRDSELIAIYNKLVAEKLDIILFSTEAEMSPDRFVSIMKSDGTLLLLAEDSENNIAGILWLNRFEGKSARMHFCIFKNWWGKSSEIMQLFREHVFSLVDSFGLPIFNTVVGYIPSVNTHAIRCALRDGCKLCGVIPDYFWDYRVGKMIDATVVYVKGEV